MFGTLAIGAVQAGLKAARLTNDAAVEHAKTLQVAEVLLYRCAIVPPPPTPPEGLLLHGVRASAATLGHLKALQAGGAVRSVTVTVAGGSWRMQRVLCCCHAHASQGPAGSVRVAGRVLPVCYVRAGA